MSLTAATTIETLAQLKTIVNITETTDPNFFPEWQAPLPELEAIAQQQLEQVKAESFNLFQYELLEPLVKMVVISPILHLAGLYQHPFHVKMEERVVMTTLDGDETIYGKVDLLVCHQQVWVVVIEAKQAGYSLLKALPQTLFYMASRGRQDYPLFGLITNGSEFQFLKLVNQGAAEYGRSHTLSLDRGDDLDTVVRILRKIARLVIA